MKLVITIDLDNAIFDEENHDLELERIFENLAHEVSGLGIRTNIRDINGNTVGNAKFTGK